MSDTEHNTGAVPQEEPQDTAADECKRERDEYLDGWKRAKADLINYKREESERISYAMKTGHERVMKDVIAVLDSMDLGLLSLADDNPAKKGMFLIKAQLEDSLKRHGLERIAVEAGETFDPLKHEAVGMIESAFPDGAVAEEVERGYSLYGKVVRPCRVRVSKGHS